MPPILSIHMWCSLPTEVRYRIRSTFKIPRSSNTVVNDGVVETDGTTIQDFTHLTVQKMQEFLNDDSNDFHKLFDKVVARVTDDLLGKPREEVIISQSTPITIVIDPIKKNKNATKK